MTLYLDSSALVKRYVTEANSDRANEILLSDHDWVTGRHAYVEVALTLGKRIPADELRAALGVFQREWDRTITVDVDEALCRSAVELGYMADARSLDALHLAAADRAGGRSIPIVTFDLRLARAARILGFSVIGS